MAVPLLVCACDEQPELADASEEAMLALDSEDAAAPSRWIQPLGPVAGAGVGDVLRADGILAELRVGERGTIRFIDEQVSVPGGGVGVLTQGASSWMAAVEAERLSPLELFMAVAPDAAPPERLRQQHDEVVEAQGRSSAAPRRLHLQGNALMPPDNFAAPSPEPLRSQATNTYDCSETSGLHEWRSNWGATLIVNHGSGTFDFAGSDTVSGNNDVHTGAETERWLGACVVSNSNVSWVVQANVSGVWTEVVGTSLSLAVDNEVRYMSSGVSRDYRARLTNATGDVTKVAAASRTL